MSLYLVGVVIVCVVPHTADQSNSGAGLALTRKSRLQLEQYTVTCPLLGIWAGIRTSTRWPAGQDALMRLGLSFANGYPFPRRSDCITLYLEILEGLRSVEDDVL